MIAEHAKSTLDQRVFVPHGIREEVQRIAREAGQPETLMLMLLVRVGVEAYRRGEPLPAADFYEWERKLFGEHFAPVERHPEADAGR